MKTKTVSQVGKGPQKSTYTTLQGLDGILVLVEDLLVEVLVELHIDKVNSMSRDSLLQHRDHDT